MDARFADRIWPVARVYARYIGVCVFAFTLLGQAVLAQTAPVEKEQLTRAIARQLDTEAALTADAREHRKALRAYYGNSASALLWVGTPRMKTFSERLQRADVDGLKISDYELPPPVSGSEDAAALAAAELAYSGTFLRYASDLKIGRLTPRKMDPELFAQTKTIDKEATLKALAKKQDVDGFFAQWVPHNPEYRALRSLLAEHREMAAEGRWPEVSAAKVLKPGMRGKRVAELRARLEASRDITITVKDPELYDQGLVMAVKRFQTRHGLEPDGAVGKGTVAALNVPVEDRIKQIILNMERWRWLPEDLGNRYIIVNIAGFNLRLVESGAVKDRMKVVVGKPYHRTPVFSGKIRYLEINPYWNVPHSIAVRAELPRFRRDPRSVERMGFEVYRGGKKVDASTINWKAVSARHFPYTLRQNPGPDNALGRVKFIFPNRFSVYLHDTPSRGLFKRAARAGSSGCIRLARPVDLAEQVLQNKDGWDRKRIDAVLASAKNTRVDLPEKLPVHLTYATAWSGEGGTINFRRDVYGRDKKLAKALFGGR